MTVRAAEDPQPELARRVAQELLHRSVAVGLRHGELVGVAQTDEGEVLGQTGDFGAQLLRLAQQLGRRVEIVLDDVTRGHLNGSYCTHYISGASAVAVGAPALLIRSTVGFSQLPVIR